MRFTGVWKKKEHEYKITSDNKQALNIRNEFRKQVNIHCGYICEVIYSGKCIIHRQNAISDTNLEGKTRYINSIYPKIISDHP